MHMPARLRGSGNFGFLWLFLKNLLGMFNFVLKRNLRGLPLKPPWINAPFIELQARSKAQIEMKGTPVLHTGDHRGVYGDLKTPPFCFGAFLLQICSDYPQCGGHSNEVNTEIASM